MSAPAARLGWTPDGASSCTVPERTDLLDRRLRRPSTSGSFGHPDHPLRDRADWPCKAAGAVVAYLDDRHHRQAGALATRTIRFETGPIGLARPPARWSPTSTSVAHGMPMAAGSLGTWELGIAGTDYPTTQRRSRMMSVWPTGCRWLPGRLGLGNLGSRGLITLQRSDARARARASRCRGGDEYRHPAAREAGEHGRSRLRPHQAHPALAQADVGVAMNTGTQRPGKPANMVDLDSDPTSLCNAYTSRRSHIAYVVSVSALPDSNGSSWAHAGRKPVQCVHQSPLPHRICGFGVRAAR